MNDLHNRFQTLDTLSAPDLWNDIQERALTVQPTPRRLSWILIAVTLLLTVIIGSAALIGSGIVKLPITVDGSVTPSSTAEASLLASSTPVEQTPASWTATGNLIEARVNHTATRLLDGSVLVTGGSHYDGTDFPTILASAELYDPSTGQWTSTGAMLGVRVGHTATLLPDGRVLVAGGGSVSDGDGGPLASAELYDPNTRTWTATGSMIGFGTGRTATLLDTGKVLVAGGSGGNSEPVPLAELYDPGTKQWTATGAMLEGRRSHTATLLLGGTVLVVGGGGASAELYDPGTGHWTIAGTTSGVRVGHTASLLPDGTVLVAGGMDGTGALSFAELYDPDTGQWTATGAMLEGRLYHTATTMLNGRVLLTGGVNSVIDGGVAVASVELYDPVTGKWTATANMADASRGRTATLLGNGTVLVTGGSGSNFETVAFADLYDPGAGT